MPLGFTQRHLKFTKMKKLQTRINDLLRLQIKGSKMLLEFDDLDFGIAINEIYKRSDTITKDMVRNKIAELEKLIKK